MERATHFRPNSKGKRKCCIKNLQGNVTVSIGIMLFDGSKLKKQRGQGLRVSVKKGTAKEELLNASHLPIDPYQYLACTHSNASLMSIMTFRFHEKTQYHLQGSRQDFSSKGRNICILIYIFHLISITIEKVKNKVSVNMLIRKENLQMDEAKAKLIACMNWIEIETRFVFFPIQYVVFLIAYQFLGDARVRPMRSRQCKQHNKFLR